MLEAAAGVWRVSLSSGCARESSRAVPRGTAARGAMSRSNAPFDRRFEGAGVLAELLELAGSPYGPEEVLAHFREAQKAGLAASDVIPTLFPEEPRFEDAALAKRLFQNLLGLWDASPGSVSLSRPGPRP